MTRFFYSYSVEQEKALAPFLQEKPQLTVALPNAHLFSVEGYILS